MPEHLKDHEKIILNEATAQAAQGTPMTETTPDENGNTTEPAIDDTPQPRQVDAVVALAETTAIILSSLTALMPPYPLDPADIMTRQKLDQSQHMLAMGMHQLHTLLAAMGSPMVAGPPEEGVPVAQPKSSIIIPGSRA